MRIEKTQIKFAKEPLSGELVGFVSRNARSRKLMGVREDSDLGKQICLLSNELKGKIKPNKLYTVHLKPMHHRNGYVVIAANPVQFTAMVGTFIVPDSIYQVTIEFGIKTIYFDPLKGSSPYSRTLLGVITRLQQRDDIQNIGSIIDDVIVQAHHLVERMIDDGYIIPDYTLAL